MFMLDLAVTETMVISENRYNPLKASPAPISFIPPEITPTYMVEMLGIQAYFSNSTRYTSSPFF